MNDFTYEDRQGMTVLPEAIDEATGQPIEGSSQVVDSRIANWVGDVPMEEQPIEVDEDAFAPENREPTFDERLSDTFDEINTSDYSISPDVVDNIVSADIGNTPEAVTVQHLAAEVYNGNLQPEEAFNEAIQTGIDMDKLMFAYYQLKEAING